VLGDDLGLKAGVAIARNFYGQLTHFAFEGLLALTVTGVASRIGNGVILGAAQRC
jgi:hypothetical protein